MFVKIFVWIILVQIYQVQASESDVIMKIGQIGQRVEAVAEKQFDRGSLAPFVANLENEIEDESDLEETDPADETLQASSDDVNCPGDGELVQVGETVRIQNVDCGSGVCGYEISRVSVYAMDTVVIDADVTCNITDFVVVSPKWTVVDERVIDLSGMPGAIPSNEAENGRTIKNKAQSGATGLPGSNAGNFIGIGMEFEDVQMLTIIANGGDGSSGLDGNRGEDGPTPDLPCSTDISCAGLKSCADSIDVMNYPSYERLYDNETDPNERLYLIYERCGESGGDGAVGGIGGYEGAVKIYPLSSDPIDATVQALRGANGSAGFGGEAGNASAIFVKCEQMFVQYWFSSDFSGFNWSINYSFANDICDGDPGQDGTNERNIQYPAENRVRPITFAVNNYKEFVRGKLLKNEMKPELKKFLEAIDNDNDIQSNYDTLALLNELYSLEEQYNQFNGEINLIDFYESLARRIEAYSKNRKEYEKSDEYKKVLNYLYAATYSKLLALKNPPQPNEATADATARKLDQIDKELAINKYKEFFNSEIKMKEDEANDFIYNHIIPEIETISTALESNLDQLLNETITFGDAVEKRRLHYQSQLQKLRQTLLLRNIFSGLKTIGLFLGFLGPYGAIAQSVLSGTTQVVEFLVLDNNIVITKPLVLPPSIKAILAANADDGFIFNGKNDSQTKVIFKLDDILKKLSKKSTTANVAANQRSAKIINTTTSAADDANRDFVALESEIRSVFSEIRRELLSSKSDRNGHISRIIKRESPAVVANDPIDPSDQNDQISDVSTGDVENALFLSDNQFKLLQEYEMKIQSSLLPLARRIKDDLKEITNNLQNKSHVTLDITRWKVQSTLKDIRTHLQRATRGFRIQNQIQSLLNKLDESVGTLVDVFDQLQNYGDQKKLADFIANINSAPSRRIVVHDAELQQALDKLEIVIMKNVLLAEEKGSPPGA